MANNIEAPMTPPTPKNVAVSPADAAAAVPTGASGITGESEVVKTEQAKFPGLSTESAIGSIEMRKEQEAVPAAPIEAPKAPDTPVQPSAPEAPAPISAETQSIQMDVPSADSEMANQIKQISDDNQILLEKQIKTLDDYSTTLDERSRKYADETKASWAARKKTQEQINKAMLGGMTKRGMQTGRARYATDYQQSMLTSEESAGVARLGELDRKEQSALNEIEAAREDNDFKLLNEKMSLMQEIQTEKKDTIIELNDLAKAEEDRAFQRLQRERQKETWEREDVDMAVADAEREVSNLLQYGGDIEDLDPAEVAKLEREAGLPAGGLSKMMESMKAAQAAEAADDQFEKNLKIVDMLKDLPAGLEVTIGDETYRGLKASTPNYSSYEVTDASGNTTTHFYDKNVGPQGETFSVTTEYAAPDPFAGLAAGIVDKSSPLYSKAESVFNGTFDLANMADSDEKEAVATMVSQMANKAKGHYEKTDNLMYKLQSTAGKKMIAGGASETLAEKMGVFSQLKSLKEGFDKVETGVITGRLQNEKFWDRDIALVNADLIGILPSVARGVFGEVGVLTDDDLDRYRETLPGMNNTEEVVDALLEGMVRRVDSQIDTTLDGYASAGFDVSGYSEGYMKVKKDISDMIGNPMPKVLAANENDVINKNPVDEGVLISIGEYLESEGIDPSEENILDEYNFLTEEQLDDFRTKTLNVTGDNKTGGLDLSKPSSGLSFNWVGGDTYQAPSGSYVGLKAQNAIPAVASKFPEGKSYTGLEGECGYWSRKISDYPSGTGDTLAQKTVYIKREGMPKEQWQAEGPRIGDVIITNESARWGHVVVVTGINPDGTVSLSESNFKARRTVSHGRKLDMNSNKIVGVVRGRLKI